MIEVDVEKLMLIVNNLFDNAVSYVNDGGTIRIAGSRTGDDLHLSISNSGSTIPSEHIPLLVERFWRGDSARSATGLHCGLGLSLCNRVAPLIGGVLRVTSENGMFSAGMTLGDAFRISHLSGSQPAGNETGAPRVPAAGSSAVR